MKIVITGGPCCGKSTIIEALEALGHKTINEVAREIILEKKYSKNLDRHKNEALHLQLDIFRRQVEKEKNIEGSKEIYFLDRGIIDTNVYSMHLLGYIPKEFSSTNIKPYDAVIVLDRITLVDDGLRRENDEQAIKLHEEIISDYKNRGYNPIIVPLMDVDKRVKRILEIVNGIGKTFRS